SATRDGSALAGCPAASSTMASARAASAPRISDERNRHFSVMAQACEKQGSTTLPLRPLRRCEAAHNRAAKAQRRTPHPPGAARRPLPLPQGERGCFSALGEPPLPLWERVG